MCHSWIVRCAWTCVLLCPGLAWSAPATPEGRWKTPDHGSAQAGLIVDITRHANGMLYGRVVEVLRPESADATCARCRDDRRDQPLRGMEIIRGMKPDGEHWSGGNILLPDKGRIHKARLELMGSGDLLEVEDCVAFFCKRQVWVRH